MFPIWLHAEITLSALNNKPKKVMLFLTQMKTVNLMKMLETRNVILDGAKAATDMSKISDVTWNHDSVQRKWAKIEIIVNTKINIKMRLHVLLGGFSEGQWWKMISELVNYYNPGVIAQNNRKIIITIYATKKKLCQLRYLKTKELFRHVNKSVPKC